VDPRAEDWLDTGFRSPEQAFGTYRTAFAAGARSLEYRCLSDRLRRELGATELAYREFRAELERREPWARCLARAQIVATERLAPDRARILAEVRVLLVRRRFLVDLVREDAWEIWDERGLVDDDFASLDELLGPDHESGVLVLELPTTTDLAPEALAEIRVIREWKIDGFAEVADDDSSAPPNPVP